MDEPGCRLAQLSFEDPPHNEIVIPRGVNMLGLALEGRHGAI